MGEKGEGIKKYKLPLIKIVRNVKYSIGNIVSNIVITMYGVRWYMVTYWGDRFLCYINI